MTGSEFFLIVLILVLGGMYEHRLCRAHNEKMDWMIRALTAEAKRRGDSQ